MSRDASRQDPAIDTMTLALLSSVLSMADRPAEMGTRLTQEIRELTGARCVLFLQCPEPASEATHHVFSISPSRRRPWAESSAARYLRDAVHHLPGTQLLPADDSSDIAGLLRQEGFDLSVVVPLLEGTVRQGEMLLLGLPDRSHLTSVADLLNQLAPAVALVLRNAFLYERQDRVIQDRTAELGQANQQLRAELLERKRVEESLRQREQQVGAILETSEESRRALLGILEDQKLSEQALARSEARLRALLDAAPFGAHQYEWKPDGQLIFVGYNSAATRILGIDHSPLLGMPIENTFPDLVPKDGLDAYRAVAHSGQRFEDVLLTHDRGTIEGAFEVSAFQTGLDRMAVLFRDITERKRAEEALQESRQRFQFAIDSAELATWDWNIRTGRILFSDRWARILEYPPDQIEPTFDFVRRHVHPDDLPTVLGQLAEHIDGHRPLFESEYRLRTRSGQWKWVLAAGKVVEWDENGRARRATGIMTDITARKLAEEAIRRQTSELATLNVLAREVSRSLSLDEVVTSAVRGVREAVQADLAFLFVREGDQLLLKGIAPDSRRELLADMPIHCVGQCLCGNAVALGQPLYSSDIFTDPRCTWDECKRAGFRSFAALPLGAGQNAIGVVGLASFAPRDFEPQANFLETLASSVTVGLQNARLFAATRQAEEELRESEARLRSIFQAAPIGIGMVSDRILTQANDRLCQMTGYAREELLGHSARLLYPSDEDFESVGRDKYRQITEHGTGTVETHWKRKDGTTIEVLLSSTPLDMRNWSAGITFTALDITDRRRLLEQLQQINAFLEQRVQERTAVAEQRAAQLRALASRLTTAEHQERRRIAHILHEHFQQLLASAKFNISALRRQMKDASLDPLLRQIDDVLDEAIRSSRSLSVELCPPILYDMGLAATMEWLGRWMRDRYNLNVTVEADPLANPQAEDMGILLFHATRELLFNIVKHARVDQATVRMSRREDGNVEILVADEGVGFDPLLQASGKDAGGFGLFGIRERIELAGGAMQVQTEPGRGTRVRLVAPIRRADSGGQSR